MGCLFQLSTGIAQLVECRSPKPQVAGSIPASRANFNKMDKLTTYIKDSYDELIHKVEWPERNVLLESTIAVIVGLLIITVFVFIMDGGINTLVDFIYKIK